MDPPKPFLKPLEAPTPSLQPSSRPALTTLMRRDWTQFPPKLGEHPWLPCTWREKKEPALARAPQTQGANGIKQMSLPLLTGLVQQLVKVNSVRFSNPKRILKPLLICLPFCFVCSAQVKGNLTFGILTANNPHQGQACCCSVSMWLTRMVGTFQLSAEGPRRHTAWRTVSYPQGRAAPNSLDFSAPRPGPGGGEMLCWMNAYIQTVEVGSEITSILQTLEASPGPKQP